MADFVISMYYNRTGMVLCNLRGLSHAVLCRSTDLFPVPTSNNRYNMRSKWTKTRLPVPTVPAIFVHLCHIAKNGPTLAKFGGQCMSATSQFLSGFYTVMFTNVQFVPTVPASGTVQYHK